MIINQDFALRLHTLQAWNVRHAEWILLVALLLAALHSLTIEHSAPRWFQWLSRSRSPSFGSIYIFTSLILGSAALIGLVVGSFHGTAADGLVWGIYLGEIINFMWTIPFGATNDQKLKNTKPSS